MGKRGFRGLNSMIVLFTRLLRGHRLTVRMIERELKVNEAAARRRYTDLLRLPGAADEQLGARRGVKLQHVVPRASATPSDVAAACLMSSIGTTLRDESLRKSIERFRTDVVSTSRQAAHVDNLDRKFWFVARGGESALPRRSTVFAETINAVLESKELTFDYVHFDGARSQNLRVQPLSLVLHDHQFYVVARSQAGILNAFRFSRISRLRMGRKFEYPKRDAYDLRRVFEYEFGMFSHKDGKIENIQLRLSKRWQHFAKSHLWHESQEVRVEKGGAVLVSLRVRVSPELRRWILWFGADAEVIKPLSLRQFVAEELAQAADKYRALAM